MRTINPGVHLVEPASHGWFRFGGGVIDGNAATADDSRVPERIIVAPPCPAIGSLLTCGVNRRRVD
jgi:hypothetical protein